MQRKYGPWVCLLLGMHLFLSPIGWVHAQEAKVLTGTLHVWPPGVKETLVAAATSPRPQNESTKKTLSAVQNTRGQASAHGRSKIASNDKVRPKKTAAKHTVSTPSVKRTASPAKKTPSATVSSRQTTSRQKNDSQSVRPASPAAKVQAVPPRTSSAMSKAPPSGRVSKKSSTSTADATQNLSAAKKGSDTANAACAWFSGKPQHESGDSVWTKGVPGYVIARQKKDSDATVVPGLNTKKVISTRLQVLERRKHTQDKAVDGETEEVGTIKGHMRKETHTWRNPITEPVKVDQDMSVTQRNIVGAYADVVNEENVQVTMGPELSIGTGGHSEYTGFSGQDEGSGLGFGMNFQVDF